MLDKLFKYQNLNNVFEFSDDENTFISSISPLDGSEWAGKIFKGEYGARKKRDELKTSIKTKLLQIQGEYCIFCGIHFSIVGTAQREHIAYKGKYGQFVFTPKNLALACAYCNGFEKKSTKDTVSKLDNDYDNCEFSIVHPYFDDYKEHLQFEYENGEKRVIIRIKNDSEKGENTINIFGLDEPIKAKFIAAAKMIEYVILDSIEADKFKQVIDNDLNY